MDQSARNVSFLDRRAEIFLLAASHTIDEIRVVIFLALAAGARLLIWTQPGAVPLVFLDRQITFWTIKNVSYGVGFARNGSQGVATSGAWLACHIETGRRQRALTEFADFRLVVCNPVTHFEFEDPPLSIRPVKLK